MIQNHYPPRQKTQFFFANFPTTVQDIKSSPSSHLPQTLGISLYLYPNVNSFEPNPFSENLHFYICRTLVYPQKNLFLTEIVQHSTLSPHSSKVNSASPTLEGRTPPSEVLPPLHDDSSTDILKNK